jgi:flagellar hook-associated protein 1 FlgK
MSLTQALSTALAGLNVTQSNLAIVAANVANAQTPGYVAKVADQITTTAGDAGNAARIAGINRQLDQFVQAQLRTETSGASFADLRANFFQQLQQIYGQPGSGATLTALFNGLTTAVQALSVSPDSTSAQAGVIGAAQAMAQQLNSMTDSIQSLRSQAELGIANDVQQANDAIDLIASINQQLASGTGSNAAAALMDQRDQAISKLASIMDIRVSQDDHQQVTVFSGSGYQLVGTRASHLAFDPQGTITPAQQWSSDKTKSSLGSISLVSPDGAAVDIMTNGGIRSGELAAYLDMRDNVLVQAQAQIDAVAAQMARAVSDKTTPGIATSGGGQAGFDIDVAGLQPGNSIDLTYTDLATNTQRKVTVIRVDDPAALPLAGTVTADPNDTVVGVNFSGGLASVVAQLNAALGSSGFQISNPSGTTLRFLDNGASTITVNAASSTTTATGLTGGSWQLPLFTDGGAPYTGAITRSGAQSTGYAGRISLNPALIADPTRLVVYQTSPLTNPGDATRPSALYSQLSKATFTFSPLTGVGGTAAPYTGTLSAFTGQMISQQSQAANAASTLKEGQDIVLNALQQRFNEASGVNIDTEMSHLLALQTTYGANARVMTTVKQMLDTLLQSV